VRRSPMRAPVKFNKYFTTPFVKFKKKFRHFGLCWLSASNVSFLAISLLSLLSRIGLDGTICFFLSFFFFSPSFLLLFFAPSFLLLFFAPSFLLPFFSPPFLCSFFSPSLLFSFFSLLLLFFSPSLLPLAKQKAKVRRSPVRDPMNGTSN
jgi:hypothetical protein